jgi:DNA primase
MSDPVLELLKTKGVAFTVSGRDYVTKCFNPDHNDSNPSFRIDRTTGIAHCFSCGFKTNIFKYYGLLTNNISIRVAKLKDKLNILKESTNGLDPLDGAKPINRSFRNVSAQTLRYFKAFETDQVEKMMDRIVFPITDVRGKTVCYVGRHSMSNGNPRYVNYPSGVSIPLFPAKFDNKYKSIVLVEGIFDMLNCYDKGLRNTVCTFGTSKLLNETKEKMLSYKVMGIEKVFILYDGDDAGREAARKIKPLLEEAGFTTEIIDLPEGQDPGVITQEDVNSLIEYTKI